jgi:hypothetical protein
MVRRWRLRSADKGLVFGMLWVGYLIQLHIRTVWPRGVMVLFILVGAAFACLYYFVAMLLNRTVITVTDEWILVRHGPIRWPGSVNIDVERLTALVCERIEQRSSSWESFRYQLPAAPTFQLHAELDNGKKVPIVRGALDMEQVAFLKERIERRLAIGGRAESGREES